MDQTKIQVLNQTQVIPNSTPFMTSTVFWFTCFSHRTTTMSCCVLWWCCCGQQEDVLVTAERWFAVIWWPAAHSEQLSRNSADCWHSSTDQAKFTDGQFPVQWPTQVPPGRCSGHCRKVVCCYLVTCCTLRTAVQEQCRLLAQEHWWSQVHKWTVSSTVANPGTSRKLCWSDMSHYRKVVCCCLVTCCTLRTAVYCTETGSWSTVMHCFRPSLFPDWSQNKSKIQFLPMQWRSNTKLGSLTEPHIIGDVWWTSAHWTVHESNMPDAREKTEISTYLHSTCSTNGAQNANGWVTVPPPCATLFLLVSRSCCPPPIITHKLGLGTFFSTFHWLFFLYTLFQDFEENLNKKICLLFLVQDLERFLKKIFFNFFCLLFLFQDLEKILKKI